MAAPFANDGSFFAKFQELQQAAQTAAPAEVDEAMPGSKSSEAQVDSDAAGSKSDSPAPAPPAEDQQQHADFQPSTSWAGPKEGFVFSTGEHGTGYYKDTPLHLRQKLQAKAKPMALKTNSSIIKGLQRRGAAAVPDPKKRKTDTDSSQKPSYLKEMERYRSMACNADTKHDRPLVK